MKKNSLTTAVVAGIAGVSGLAGIANAVNVNPDGLGQVLLYPYYTVNGNNATLISVVNTTDRAKAVKVRFLESLNSAEVLDFNLYLSEFDVWTANVLQTTGGGAILTRDTSCTVPNGVGKDWVGSDPGPLSRFLPYEFQRAGGGGDVIGRSGRISLGGIPGNEVDISAAERMRQGYIEMIEMGVLFNEGTTAASFRPEFWATHNTSGAPNNCAALQAAWTSPAGAWVANNGRAVDAPTGGLFGGAMVVDVPFGRSFSYNADAIDGFWSPVGLGPDVGGSEADLHTNPGDLFPNLGQARTEADESATANVFVNGVVVTANFAEGIDAVSAALMQRFIFNEYNLETGLNAASEWVITFPTKRTHIDVPITAGLDVRPFSDRVNVETIIARNDNRVFDTYGSCETYDFTAWNREESPSAPPPDQTIPPEVSPRPDQPGVTPPTYPQLCWEANVVAFNQDLATATTATAILGVSAKQGAHGLTQERIEDAGWARIEFNHPDNADGVFTNYLVSNDGVAFVGLPVLGFWVADYTNLGAAAGIRANFSGIHKHRGARGYATGVIAPPAANAPFNANAAGLSTFGLS
jgi:hypothetical protein